MTPGSFMALGIFLALLGAWAYWPRLLWPVPDPEAWKALSEAVDRRVEA